MHSKKMKHLYALEILSTKIHNFFEQQKYLLTTNNQIVRIEVKINNLNPLIWLWQQKTSVKTYWSDREQKFEMAGVGETDVVYSQNIVNYSSVFTSINNRLSPSYKNLRYYGGISFRQKQVIEPSWQQFGNYRFIVPKFEVYAQNNQTYLACNFIPNGLEDYQPQLNQILHELEQLVFNTAFEIPSLPLLIGRTDLPDRNGWYQNIKSALASFASGETSKIVLARKSKFEFVEQIEPLSLLLLLKNANSQLFHFCFQPSVGNAFIGGSPERLYSRQERLLQTEAVAGTRSRGKSLEEDQKLSEQLLNSEKDLREHQFVVHSLRGILYNLCHSVGQHREPVLLKLNKVQHLYTACNGILFDGVYDADILPMLHPTPAVGGYPKQEALEAINKIEPFERGWYAGPVGWVGHNAAEFSVAIRSGLVEDDKLSLFSGAGIVQGSKPKEEWQEIENKIASFVQILSCFDLLKNLNAHSIAQER